MFDAEIEWNCPDHFPDLSKAEYIAIDLETRDPNLKTRGSGAVIGEGEIIGIAVASRRLVWILSYWTPRRKFR
jgi:uncharacterized oligopeptide transporter (OPT) family protein